MLRELTSSVNFFHREKTRYATFPFQKRVALWNGYSTRWTKWIDKPLRKQITEKGNYPARYTVRTAPFRLLLLVKAVIDGGDDMEKVLVAAFQRYCVSNPLHPDVFPAIRQMEAEIVAMCLRMYNNPTGAGATTSGGTESILISVKTHRDWARAVKGISEPEMYANSFCRLYAERVHRTHPG
jgi:hypothetical protein